MSTLQDREFFYYLALVCTPRELSFH